jgi:hypothetical protein
MRYLRELGRLGVATLAGQRAQFTWALNQYNSTEDADEHAKFAKRMAKYIAAAPVNGFTPEQITQGQSYPATEVAKYLNDPALTAEPDITEEKAIQSLASVVDESDVIREGQGNGVLYAYGYRCCREHDLSPEDMETGGVVGIAEIVDCVTDHRSRWFEGPYGFVLRNRRPLPFVKWTGSLGPRDAPARLVRRLGL